MSPEEIQRLIDKALDDYTDNAQTRAQIAQAAALLLVAKRIEHLTEIIDRHFNLD